MAQKSKKKHDKKHDGKKKQKVTVIEESPLASHGEADDDLLSSLEGIAEKEEKKKAKQDSGGKKKKKKDKSGKKDKDKGKGKDKPDKREGNKHDEASSDDEHLKDLDAVAAGAAGGSAVTAAEEEEDDGLLDVDDLMPDGVKVPETGSGPSLNAVPQMGISSFSALADKESASEPLDVPPSITPQEVAYHSQMKAEHASTAHIAPPTPQQQVAQPQQAASAAQPQQVAQPQQAAQVVQPQQVAEPVQQTYQAAEPVQPQQVAEPVQQASRAAEPEAIPQVEPLQNAYSPQPGADIEGAAPQETPHAAELNAEFERLERELKEGATPLYDPTPKAGEPLAGGSGDALETGLQTESSESASTRLHPSPDIPDIAGAAAAYGSAAQAAEGAGKVPLAPVAPTSEADIQVPVTAPDAIPEEDSWTCGKCGTVNRKQDIFCTECGALTMPVPGIDDDRTPLVPKKGTEEVDRQAGSDFQSDTTDPTMSPVGSLDDISAAADAAIAAAAGALGVKAVTDKATASDGASEKAWPSTTPPDSSLPVAVAPSADDVVKPSVPTVDDTVRPELHPDALSASAFDGVAEPEAASYTSPGSNYTPVSQEPSSRKASPKAQLRTEIEPIDAPVVDDAETPSLEDVIANLSGGAASAAVVTEGSRIATDGMQARPSTQPSDARDAPADDLQRVDAATPVDAPRQADAVSPVDNLQQADAVAPAVPPHRAIDVPAVEVPEPDTKAMPEGEVTGTTVSGTEAVSSSTDAQGAPKAMATQTDAVAATTDAKPKGSKRQMIILIVLLIVLAAVIGVVYGLKLF